MNSSCRGRRRRLYFRPNELVRAVSGELGPDGSGSESKLSHQVCARGNAREGQGRPLGHGKKPS